MSVGREYIFRRGSKPLVTERVDITKNKAYQKVTEQYEKRIREAESRERR